MKLAPVKDDYAGFAVDVGKALKKAQMDSGVSVTAIAQKTRLSRWGIQKIFAGQAPTLRSLYLICKAMNTKPGICIVGVCTEEER